MHLLLCDRGSEPFLVQELGRAFPHARHEIRAPGLVAGDFLLQPELPPILAFARQILPELEEHHAPSVGDWAEWLLDKILQAALEPHPWQLHIVPHYPALNAGQHRCGLIHQSIQELLRRKRRTLLRALQKETAAFTQAHSLVQLLLTAPDHGLLAIAPAPLPFQLRQILSPFPKGELPIVVDKTAPSRAFAKLLEAETRLGHRIAPGQTCIDLGAAPGSWSFVALGRGASVTAVDRARLRTDLMRHPRLRFMKGDAFRFTPDSPVDWLLCDVIAAPLRSIELLIDWARHRRMRGFVVTIKFKGHAEYGLLEHLKHALPPLCEDFFLTRLCANKNEICAFGTLRNPPPLPP